MFRTELEEQYFYLLKLMSKLSVFVGEDEKPYLLMNDTFGYACADGETFEVRQSKYFWELYQKFGGAGLTAFVSLKRDSFPLKEHITAEYEMAIDYLRNSGVTITPSEEE